MIKMSARPFLSDLISHKIRFSDGGINLNLNCPQIFFKFHLCVTHILNDGRRTFKAALSNYYFSSGILKVLFIKVSKL